MLFNNPEKDVVSAAKETISDALLGKHGVNAINSSLNDANVRVISIRYKENADLDKINEAIAKLIREGKIPNNIRIEITYGGPIYALGQKT